MTFTAINGTNTPHTFIVFTGADATEYQLPDARTIAGQSISLKNRGTGEAIIGTTAGQTIDGDISITLGSQFSERTVFSDGQNWNSIGGRSGNGGGSGDNSYTRVLTIASGQSVQLADDVSLTVLGTSGQPALASLTIVLPQNPFDGQIVNVQRLQTINAINVNSNGLVLAGKANYVVEQSYQFQYLANPTPIWIRRYA